MSNCIQNIRAISIANDFREATQPELKQALMHVLMEYGLNCGTANNAQDVQAITRCSVWSAGNPMNAFFYVIPLSVPGVTSIECGNFSPVAPDNSDICGLVDQPGGLFLNACDAQGPLARKDMLETIRQIRYEVFNRLPCYTRSLSYEGKRRLAGFGFRPVKGSLKGLWKQAKPQSQ